MQQCEQKFKTEYEPFTETECSTEYKQDCQFEWRGHGNDKVWAPIAGTCQNVPYNECKEVAKTRARQVAYQECDYVPKKVCVTIPDEICTNQPLTECQDVPKQMCYDQHKRVPVRISRKEAKKVCDVPGEDATVTVVPSPAPALAPAPPSSPGVVPTFTAPAPVPTSPVFNEQPNLGSHPLDQQRGGLDPGPVVDQQLDQIPQLLDQQGGLSTLDEILAARKANVSNSNRQPTLSEKLVFPS